MKKLILTAILALGLHTQAADQEPYIAPAKSPELKKSMIIAAVVITPSNQVEVWLNSRRVWNKEGRLTDSYSAEEQRIVEPVTDAASLCNLQESIYEPCQPGLKIRVIKAQLESLGVEIQPDFQKWAQEEVSK